MLITLSRLDFFAIVCSIFLTFVLTAQEYFCVEDLPTNDNYPAVQFSFF